MAHPEPRGEMSAAERAHEAMLFLPIADPTVEDALRDLSLRTATRDSCGLSRDPRFVTTENAATAPPPDLQSAKL